MYFTALFTNKAKSGIIIIEVVIMRLVKSEYTLVLDNEELDAICEAIQHLRLDREFCSNNPEFVSVTVRILNGLVGASSKARDVSRVLIEDYKKQCDELMSEEN